LVHFQQKISLFNSDFPPLRKRFQGMIVENQANSAGKRLGVKSPILSDAEL
jgi:hypothetical protein